MSFSVFIFAIYTNWLGDFYLGLRPYEDLRNLATHGAPF